LSHAVLAVHGGAGRLFRRRLTNEKRQAYEAGLTDALVAGQRILLRGGRALDAVTEAVRTMEDNELFNAARGSVLCADATVEMSAAIMQGRDLSVGAVVGLKRTKNPILAARALMKHSHVLLFGSNADRFAETNGLEMVPAPYFYTRARRRQWKRFHESEILTLDDAGLEYSDGTVGAVAWDKRGNLAAATSTGGLFNQLAGRVGDTPVIGAGTWADNKTCAVSGTGNGDAFARISFARRVADLIELKRISGLEAALVGLDELNKVKGKGGCILIDSRGSIYMPFNTPQMLRGWVRGKETPTVAISSHQPRVR
jgi:beta-aspartyl-peptidase (threonine type)